MTGRGIDQILPHPGDPTLREPVADARRYVTYAETASGPSAAVSIVVAIDKLLGRKQYVHVVATGLMCIPPSAPRVEICDHLTPVSLEGFTSSLRVAETAPACAKRPCCRRSPGGLRASCDSVVTTACVRC